MHQKNPPRIAAWMMEHLRPTGCDEAVAGDLIEEYCGGRSAGWYWHQVITAIAVAWSRSVWQRRAALLFAALWSFFSPAWLLLYLRHFRNGRLDDVIWRLPFPWSTICAFALGTARDLLFIWLGVLVYVVLCQIAVGKLHIRRFGKAFLSSFVAYAAAGTCEIAIAISLEPHFQGPGVDWRTLTMIGVLKDITLRSALAQIPFFVGAAGALWFLTSGSKRPANLAA